ncbi:hypothetical protein NB694_000135 [Pantoea ananatis]|nr:hypothetical protein [Pantoea ananatis]
MGSLLCQSRVMQAIKKDDHGHPLVRLCFQQKGLRVNRQARTDIQYFLLGTLNGGFVVDVI